MSDDRTSKHVVLLDCPFCGGPAETDSLQAYRGIATGDIGHAAAVYCTGSCSAQMSLCYADVPDLPRERVLEVLIENWNRRRGVQPVETFGERRLMATRGLLDRAIQVMTEFHAEFEPDDSPELRPTTSVHAFKDFVDRHARLMYERAQLDKGLPEEPSEPRGKPCTCQDTSASACGVERGHKLGELWYCRRAAEKTTAPPCGNPVMINSERYRGCRLPSGHEGECSAQKATPTPPVQAPCGCSWGHMTKTWCGKHWAERDAVNGNGDG